MDALDAMEGVSSSPPRTDPRYAVASQGITLGTQDTEGEDEDDVLDSDMRDFVVEGDEEDVLDAAPLLTSSMEAPRGRVEKRRRLVGGRKVASVVVESEVDDDDDDNDDDMPILNGVLKLNGDDTDGDSDDLPDLSKMVTGKNAKEKPPQLHKRRRMVVEEDDDSE